MPADYDPAIRDAVAALNRLPGVRSTASCQGKGAPGEGSSHAELAYVRFRDPVPLRIEEELIRRVGSLSRVEPISVYCRSPDRNGRFCVLLEEAATALLRESRRPERRVPLPRRHVETRLRDHFETAPGESPGLCFGCGSLVTAARHCDEPVLGLLPRDFTGLDGVVGRFLEDDPDPPDPRLVAREGTRAIRARILRGDFGTEYLGKWESFLRTELDRWLRKDVRSFLATQRRNGRTVDLVFEGDTVTFEIASCDFSHHEDHEARTRRPRRKAEE